MRITHCHLHGVVIVSRNLERANENDGFKMTALELYIILLKNYLNNVLFIFSHTEQEGWATGEEDHIVARAEFDFEAEGTNEISFRSGSMLNLAPKGNSCDSLYIV